MLGRATFQVTCSLFALLDPKYAYIYVQVRRVSDERRIKKGITLENTKCTKNRLAKRNA